LSVMVVAAYASTLAFEFCLLRWTRGTDPSPELKLLQIVRAWWGEVLHGPLVFGWRQPFFGQRWPDLLPADAHGRRGLLLVHGFFCNRGLWNAWLARLTAQGVPFVAVTLEPPFGSIDIYAPTINHAIDQLRQCTGLPPVVVAHSMGGLAVRRAQAYEGDSARIHRLITLGTPHHGTWLARMAFSLNGRQMRQKSAWLQALATQEAAIQVGPCTCFYSHCDNIVFPPSAATLPGADNRHLTAVAHVHMVDHAQPWVEVQRWLAPDSPAPNLNC
jgi:triacylglycerol lipase